MGEKNVHIAKENPKNLARKENAGSLERGATVEVEWENTTIVAKVLRTYRHFSGDVVVLDRKKPPIRVVRSRCRKVKQTKP